MNDLLASKPIVAGLALKMHVGENKDIGLIGGPAIYAAIGLAHTGLLPRLMTAIGNDLSKDDKIVLKGFGLSSVNIIREMRRPMIKWYSGPILGSTGRGQLSDDPTCWRVFPEYKEIDGQPLVLANGDPEWYAKLLDMSKPSLVIMDIHSEWMGMRSRELNACLSRADIVTMTDHEYRLLPKSAFSGCIFGQKNKILILKNGDSGVKIFVEGKTRKLPPPTPKIINTDIGCGDLLIGTIAGYFILENLTNTNSSLSDKIETAYLNSLGILTSLIESESPRHFITGWLTKYQ